MALTLLLASALALPQKKDEKKPAEKKAAEEKPAANTRGNFGCFGCPQIQPTPGSGFGGFNGPQIQPGHGQSGFGQPQHNQGFGQQGFGQQGFPQQGGFGGQQGGFGGQQGGFGGGQVRPQTATCRYWCKTPEGANYCCESNNKAPKPDFGSQVVKPGSCPVVRAECPIRSGGFQPPRDCSKSGDCPGADRCCYDRCLQQHVCKAPVYNNFQG